MKKTGIVRSIVVAAIGTGLLGGTEALWACNCYYDSECPSGFHCMAPICSLDGKTDGVCIQDGGGGGDIVPDGLFLTGTLDPGNAGFAADLYFRAYMVPIRQGAGRPDQPLLDAAGRVPLGRTRQDHDHNHRVLLQAIHEVLDATLGFDFQTPDPFDVLELRAATCDLRFRDIRPESDPVQRRFGAIRGVPPGAVDLVEAARQGFVDALKSGAPDRVALPLDRFWTAHPDYRPNHAGRYYPHGHEGDPADTEAAQVRALSVRVGRLLGRETR